MAFGLIVAIAIGADVWVRWELERKYIPNQWLGNMGMFGRILELYTIVSLCSLTAIITSLVTRRYLVAIGLLILYFSPCFWFPHFGSPTSRYEAEKAQYHAAITKHVRYGDQFEEKVDGRTLTYWRWWAGGLDNAEGIIYDPANRLDQEVDFRAFQGQTGGTMYRIERLEPCWYFVVHS